MLAKPPYKFLLPVHVVARCKIRLGAVLHKPLEGLRLWVTACAAFRPPSLFCSYLHTHQVEHLRTKLKRRALKLEVSPRADVEDEAKVCIIVHVSKELHPARNSNAPMCTMWP